MSFFPSMSVPGSAFRLAAPLAILAFATSAFAIQHPVFVEGNCDSPVPGTTIVTAGTCGDFDGDGRIGTAEDTDGADRIFGTIGAALGPGTGAAAGTGINLNGAIMIVASGRFAEQIVIGDLAGPTFVTIEAAPGVSAAIDAVFQGDPAGGNATRQAGIGISVTATGTDDRILLRNLAIRSWAEGVRVSSGARVTIDNCRFEHNLDYAVRVQGSSHVAIYRSQITDTGFRTGANVNNVPAAGTGGTGVFFEGTSRGVVATSVIFGSFRNGLLNSSTMGRGAVRYHDVVADGNTTAGVVNAVHEAH